MSPRPTAPGRRGCCTIGIACAAFSGRWCPGKCWNASRCLSTRPSNLSPPNSEAFRFVGGCSNAGGMWQLYQFPLCPFSRKVRLLLGEKGVGYELVRESPWQRRDEFLDMNPAGQTPEIGRAHV